MLFYGIFVYNSWVTDWEDSSGSFGQDQWYPDPDDEWELEVLNLAFLEEDAYKLTRIAFLDNAPGPIFIDQVSVIVYFEFPCTGQICAQSPQS